MSSKSADHVLKTEYETVQKQIDDIQAGVVVGDLDEAQSRLSSLNDELRNRGLLPSATAATMQLLQQTPLRIGELLEINLPEVGYLVDELLRSGLILAAGAGKIGKSVLFMQLALAMSRGSEFLDFGTRKRSVVYISLENSPSDIQDYALRQGYSKFDPADVIFPKWANKKEGYNKIRELIHTDGYGVVILDSLESFDPELKHNDSDAVKPILQEFRDILRDTKASIIVIDHCNKSVYTPGTYPFAAIRGSGTKLSGVDVAMVIQEKENNEALVTIRGYQPSQQVIIRQVPETYTWELVGEATKIVTEPELQDLLNAISELGEAARNKNLAEWLGVKPYKVSRLTQRATKRGLISRDENEVFRLVA